MIWIIAGTSEASKISSLFGNHPKILYTIATEEGLEFLSSKNVFIGRMNLEEMKDFAIENEIDAIFDLSHPFADIVTKNAKALAEKLNISYYRYLREENLSAEDAIYVSSYEEAYGLISQLKGNFLFTTGSKKVKEFQRVRGENRFIFRVLPTVPSMQDLKNARVEMRDSLGMLGPFSLEMNQLLLKQYKIDYLVTKDSGKAGGVDEKLEACRLENVKAIIISREKEIGIKSFNDLIDMIKENI